MSNLNTVHLSTCQLQTAIKELPSGGVPHLLNEATKSSSPELSLVGPDSCAPPCARQLFSYISHNIFPLELWGLLLKYPRKDMESQKGVWSCEYCGHCGMFRDITGRRCGTTHYSKCDHYPLECPNECNETNMRRDMKTHCSVCCLEPLDWQFKDVGCADKIRHKYNVFLLRVRRYVRERNWTYSK